MLTEERRKCQLRTRKVVRRRLTKEKERVRRKEGA